MRAYATTRIIDQSVSSVYLTPRQFPRCAYTAGYSLLLLALSPMSYNSGHKLFADSEFGVHGNGEANVGRGRRQCAYNLAPGPLEMFQPRNAHRFKDGDFNVRWFKSDYHRACAKFCFSFLANALISILIILQQYAFSLQLIFCIHYSCTYKEYKKNEKKKCWYY